MQANSLWLKILNFYIYSSLHIAIGASLFVIESYIIYRDHIDWYYIVFVFLSTLWIYSIHKLVGMRSLDPHEVKGRFEIIRTYYSHIVIYLILSSLGLLYLLQYMLPWLTIMLPVGIISILYVLPIFPKGRRLRDYDWIKIFLIAFVWAWVSTMIPLNGNPVHVVAPVFAERFLFIIAITLPFDIRDIDIDRNHNLKTIAASLGSIRTVALAYLLLVTGSLVLCMTYTGPFDMLTHTIIITVMTTLCIKSSVHKASDYYYSGLIDGTLLTRGLVAIMISSIS